MYGEFGAMRFPLGHELVQYLIQEKFKLPTEPFSMAADNFIFLQGRAVRASEFTSSAFDFDLHDDELDRTPKDILNAAVAARGDHARRRRGRRVGRLLTEYDHYSVIAFLRDAD